MINLSILLVLGLAINANGHFIKQLLHNMREKYNLNHGHHRRFFEGDRYLPFEAKPLFKPEMDFFSPTSFGISSHQHPIQYAPDQNDCRNYPCAYASPNNGPAFSPPSLYFRPTYEQPIYQPAPIAPIAPINTPNTININNINANNHEDATSISSVSTDVNANMIPTISTVPNYPTGINGFGSINSQSVQNGHQANINYDQTQSLNPSIALSNAHSTKNNINKYNNNAYSTSTSKNNHNRIGTTFGSNPNYDLATSNGQAHTISLNAQTTSLNTQTTTVNAQTTNLNAQSLHLNGNSNNNAMIIDLTKLNGLDALTTPVSDNVNKINGNNYDSAQTIPSYTELPQAYSTTSRPGMEHDIDIRFGDDQDKNESKKSFKN